MTEEIRDAARAGPGSADATPAPPGGGEPPVPPEASESPVPPAAAGGEAVDFGAQTLDAERLPPPPAPDFRDKWLRAEAELQNSRRRAARERDDAVRSAEDRVLLDVIEALDDLERALSALTPEQAAGAWAQGVALTAQRMRDALARRGVTPIPALGAPFDPLFHEALLEVPAPEGVAPGCVAQEVQKGYRRGERALRVARVVVAKADH